MVEVISGCGTLGCVRLCISSPGARRIARTPSAAWTGPGFISPLIAAGLALTLVVEIFCLQGRIGEMNTVFKFFLRCGSCSLLPQRQGWRILYLETSVMNRRTRR